MFFSEEKNQKTFASAPAEHSGTVRPIGKLLKK
jgi:hypothetical protein